ncbi:unnamed protein product [Cuscuta campestris]|uniref:E3 ubiquitin-protein ligase RMA n=1 Tax=Cuscuta campestris TaxID=132261 RepID=A0A484N8Z4_9ASTE|nr:unnamed protein product [Cuscuta campestris]
MIHFTPFHKLTVPSSRSLSDFQIVTLFSSAINAPLILRYHSRSSFSLPPPWFCLLELILRADFADDKLTSSICIDPKQEKRVEDQFQKNMVLENASTSSLCFDCNICLESAHDPVVTLCGHLYCWPCIYKWLHVQGPTPDSEDHPQCPVCKARISKSTLVPLYGRGCSSSSSSSDTESKKHGMESSIPQRPPAIGTNMPLPNAAQPREQPHSPPPFHAFGSFGPSVEVAGIFSPNVGMFGEMIFARMLGCTDTTVFAYPSASAFAAAGGGGSPRVRRQEMQVEKSLNRLSIFLLCCLILCLLLF